MNIIKDIGEFYQKNEQDINNSLVLKNEKQYFFHVDENCQEITSIYKLEEGEIQQIYLKNDSFNFDINDVKNIIFNNIMFDINSPIDGAKNTPMIYSTQPSVITFNLKFDKEGVKNDKIKDNVETNTKKYLEIWQNEYKTYVNLEFGKTVSNFIYTHLETSNEKFIFKLPQLVDENNKDGILLINGKKINFIYYYNEYKDSYKKNYETYLRKYLTVDFDGENAYRETNGGNSKKLYITQNKKTIFKNFFLKDDNKEDYYYYYVKFLLLKKYIPNAEIIIDQNYVSFINDVNYNNLGYLFNNIKDGTKEKDLKVYNKISGDYRYITLDNLIYKYTKINYDDEFNYIPIEVNRYDLYRELFNLFSLIGTKCSFINLYDDNKKKNIYSDYSQNEIPISNLYNLIKNDIVNFIYYNTGDIVKVYDKIVNFIIENHLYFKKGKEGLYINQNLLIKIIELNNNLKQTQIKMEEIEKNIFRLVDYVYFTNLNDLEKELNEKTKELVDDEKLRFEKNKNLLKVKKKYLINNYEIEEYVINDIQTYSYSLGILIGFLQSLSSSIRKDDIILSYKNKTVKETLTLLSDNKHIIQALGVSDNNFNKIYSKTLAFIGKTEFLNCKIDYIIFMCAYTNNNFKKFINTGKK